MGRITAEDACDQAAFLTVIITTYIFVKKILQTVNSVDDYGGNTRAYDISLRLEEASEPPAFSVPGMSAADKGLITPVLLRDYNLDHRNVSDQPLILSILTRV